MLFNRYIDPASGRTNYKALKEASNRMQPGTKWRGERSDTLNAAMDRDMLTQRQATSDTKYGGISGTAGQYKFALIADDGDTKVQGQPLPFNINGKKTLMYPGPNGVFTVNDGNLMKEEQKYYEERQKYLNEMVKLCLASDAQCAKVLGIKNAAELKALLGQKGKITLGGGDILQDLPDESLQATAMPSVLSEIAVDSLAFSWGISKLKAVIGHINPIIESDITPAGVDPNDQTESKD